MIVKTRVHLHPLPDGTYAVETCDGESKGVMAPADKGSARAVKLEPVGDGVHFLLDEGSDGPGGPAQVSTSAYRAGWDHTFRIEHGGAS